MLAHAGGCADAQDHPLRFGLTNKSGHQRSADDHKNDPDQVMGDHKAEVRTGHNRQHRHLSLSAGRKVKEGFDLWRMFKQIGQLG